MCSGIWSGNRPTDVLLVDGMTQRLRVQTAHKDGFPTGTEEEVGDNAPEHRSVIDIPNHCISGGVNLTRTARRTPDCTLFGDAA